MDIIISFVLGNISKFLGHLFFPYEESLIVDLVIGALIYLIVKKRFTSFLAAAIGYGTHEFWFTEIGHNYDMVYRQYDSLNFYFSTIGFFICLYLTTFALDWCKNKINPPKKQTWFK
ncbi:MAG: hypothetical protein ACNI27_10995 [Desulfovibrio sp.]